MVSGNKVLLNDHEVSYLLKVYRIPYLNTDVSTMQSLIGRFITQYKQLESNGLVWGSQTSLSKRSSYVRASWHGQDGEVNATSFDLRPAVILCFFKHNLTVAPHQSQTHVFAKVKWFASHHARHLFGSPVEVWCSNLFEVSGPSQYLPFHRIHSQFIAGYYRHQQDNVLCVCPSSPKCYV